MRKVIWKPAMYCLGAKEQTADRDWSVYGYISFTEQDTVLIFNRNNDDIWLHHNVSGIESNLNTIIKHDVMFRKNNLKDVSLYEKINMLGFLICYCYNELYRKKNVDILNISDVVHDARIKFQELEQEEIEDLMNNKGDEGNDEE